MERTLIVGGRAPARWEPPSGQSPFFGWLGNDDQPNSVHFASVTALTVNAQGRFCVALSNGGIIALTAEARDRLLKRMGWSAAKLVRGA